MNSETSSYLFRYLFISLFKAFESIFSVSLSIYSQTMILTVQQIYHEKIILSNSALGFSVFFYL